MWVGRLTLPALPCAALPPLRSLPAAAMKGMKLPKNLKGDMNPRNMQQNIAQMSRMLPPHMLKMMGGPAALQSLIKQMDGKF
jgi:signal recognition particle subunit SRP54